MHIQYNLTNALAHYILNRNGKGNPGIYPNSLNQSTRFYGNSNGAEPSRSGRYPQYDHRNHGGYAGNGREKNWPSMDTHINLGFQKECL